jgi:2-methylcitrate dehydratase PrpD
LLILSSGFRVKRFPNCGSAHRAMDGLIALQERHGFDAGGVAQVHVSAPVTHLDNLMYVDPRSGLEAKFSLEYALAVLLATGRCTLDDFTDEAVARAEVRAFFPQVVRHPVDKAEGEFPTRVEVVMRDGRRHEIDVAMPAGSLAAPFTIDQLWAKHDGCVAGRLNQADRASLRALLSDFPDLGDVAPLMALLSGAR